MIKMALKMLWLERKNALNMIFNISVTLMVCLIFMQYYTNPYLKSVIRVDDILLFSENFAKTLLSFGIYIVCISLIGYACSYYIRVHSREIGLLKMAGYNHLKIALYLFIQEGSIVLVSCIITMIASIVFIPLSLLLIYSFQGIKASLFGFYFETYLYMFGCVPFILLLTMAIGLRFIISLNTPELLQKHNIVSYRKDSRVLKMPDAIYLLAYLLGLYSMYAGKKFSISFVIASCIGAVGAYGMFYYWIPHVFNEMIDDLELKGNRFIYLADLALFMQQSKSLILYIMISIILLPTFILASKDSLSLYGALNIAFILVNVVLSISLINRFCIDHYEKKEHFQNLKKIGLNNKDIEQISLCEGNDFYYILYIFTGIYLLSIFFAFYFKSQLDFHSVILILIEYFIPYLFSQIYIVVYKRRKIKCLLSK